MAGILATNKEHYNDAKNCVSKDDFMFSTLDDLIV